MMGVCLAVLLLASGCGPSLHQRSQACLASKDAQSVINTNFEMAAFTLGLAIGIQFASRGKMET